MIGPDAQSAAACSGDVGSIITVERSGAFSGLHVNEGDGIVLLATDAGRIGHAEARDAQALPVDAIAFSSDFMLIARNIDAINAVGGIDHLLASEIIFLPNASPHHVALAHCKAEALSAVAVPLPAIVALSGNVTDARSVALQFGIKHAGISRGTVLQ